MAFTRRTALIAGGSFMLSGWRGLLAGNRGIVPELILHNANIWTVDPASPTAQALAIANGRILAVGSNDFVLGLAVAQTRKVDIGKHRITPGFIDAHAHPAASGLQYVRDVDCGLSSIEAIKAALRDRSQKVPAGAWVKGFSYDDGKTPRPLTLADLDDAVPDHPVVVAHRGGHSLFVNTLAMKAVGYDRNTPSPPGGLIEKDAAGNLTGKVADDARLSFEKLSAQLATRTDWRDAAMLISKRAAARGITSVCDAMGDADILQGYRDAATAGPPQTRVYCCISYQKIQPFLDAGISTGFGDEAVRVGPVKLWVDGSISERTAWVSEPYVGTNFHGVPVGTREDLYELASKPHQAGWQLATHANGDLAIDEVLSVYEQIQREMPRRDPRYRLEHCSVVTPEIIARIRALGAVPIPFSAYVSFHGDVMHFYGEQRTRHMFAMRDFLNAGIPAAASSDFGASPMDPPLWLQSQVTRSDPQGHVWGANQKISVAEAVRCGTLNGAYSMFAENEKGSLQPGRLADLVVWDRDMFAVDPSELAHISPQRTMIGGKWAYET